MKLVKTVYSAIQSFWANSQQRKTITLIIGSFSIALIAFGGYQIIDGHREYNDRTDELDEVTAQIDIFVGQYPLVERDGEMTHDLTDASDTDKQYLALLHTRERTIYNNRVDAENQRNSGIRLLGIGVIGLALAYLVLPENITQPEESSEASDASVQKTSSEKNH